MSEAKPDAKQFDIKVELPENPFCEKCETKELCEALKAGTRTCESIGATLNAHQLLLKAVGSLRRGIGRLVNQAFVEANVSLERLRETERQLVAKHKERNNWIEAYSKSIGHYATLLAEKEALQERLTVANAKLDQLTAAKKDDKSKKPGGNGWGK